MPPMPYVLCPMPMPYDHLMLPRKAISRQVNLICFSSTFSYFIPAKLGHELFINILAQ